jgi:hypothetical protein
VRPLVLTLLVLVAVSVCMTVVFFGHAVVTGTVLPEPDAPPAKAASMAEQSGIGSWLYLGAEVSWLVTFAAGVTTAVLWVAKRKRTRTEEKR